MSFGNCAAVLAKPLKDAEFFSGGDVIPVLDASSIRSKLLCNLTIYFCSLVSSFAIMMHPIPG